MRMRLPPRERSDRAEPPGSPAFTILTFMFKVSGFLLRKGYTYMPGVRDAKHEEISTFRPHSPINSKYTLKLAPTVSLRRHLFNR